MSSGLLHGYLEINNVWTHVASWGRWVEDDSPSEVIIFLPGNPGVVEFYYPHLDELHRLTNIPVWIIGHAGHEEPPPGHEDEGWGPIGGTKGREELFNLEGQLQHKREFIVMFIEKFTKVHIIGHSIGAWMAMELLKDSYIGPQIWSVNLLFPTLQHMALTPNGFWINQVARRINPILTFGMFLLNLLPVGVKKFLIGCYFAYKSIPHRFVPTVLSYLCPSVIGKVLFMAYDEMDKVKELDINNLQIHQDKVKIMYSENDGWAPGHLFRDLAQRLPNLHIEKKPFCHAYVLNSSIDVARILADNIQNAQERPHSFMNMDD